MENNRELVTLERAYLICDLISLIIVRVLAFSDLNRRKPKTDSASLTRYPRAPGLCRYGTLYTFDPFWRRPQFGRAFLGKATRRHVEHAR